jgi:SAM-dependent methyltransferase
MTGMTDADRESLRATFSEIPELYDRARPTYPPPVFDDLVVLGELPSAARIVEIGCGTGQATVPLAERGYRISCVELGAGLAEFARRKLDRFDAVEVIHANFESWLPAKADFDAVVAFTSFHWIDPEQRYAKVASVLRPAGILAVVFAEHVLADDGDDFFAAVQEDYLAATDETDPSPPPHPDDVGDLRDEIVSSGLFKSVATRRYLWDIVYTAEEYIAVLETYSGHRSLEERQREQLYKRIRERIAARPERTVRKTNLATLNIAQAL